MFPINNKIVFVTGSAGFVGSYVSKAFLEKGFPVIGLDNLNSYYDTKLKEARLELLNQYRGFSFVQGDLANMALLFEMFRKYKPDIVINLAAQAGVRYSVTNPRAYIDSNIVGFFNILEACRHSYDSDFITDGYQGVQHLVYASSSSVYGSNKKVPYSVKDKVDNPISLYAATKKSNELMAYAYSNLYGIPSTGLRFFTVYGPMGRPDMAYYSFTNKMVRGEKIQIFNHGDMYRDFTYIDDIVTGILKVAGKVPEPNEDGVRHHVYNIGNNKPESLLYFVDMLERVLLEEGVIKAPAEREYLPMQPGDVYQTYADVDDLIRDFGFQPETSLETGLRKFVKWYKEYY